MKRPERRRLREKGKKKEKELSCLRCKKPKADCACVHPIPSEDGKTSNGYTLDQVLKMEYQKAVSYVARDL